MNQSDLKFRVNLLLALVIFITLVCSIQAQNSTFKKLELNKSKIYLKFKIC